MSYRPVVLAILDGWGVAPPSPYNAVHLANTPVWDRLLREFPHSTLQASELDVGLPAGQMGNSEVGHMNIGCGRVVMQDLPRIDAAIADGSLARNAQLQAMIAGLQQSGGACHLLGLVSDGGVHAHQAHIAALARIVAAAGVPVVIHAFLDGRDTSPKSAHGYVAELEAAVADTSRIRLGTVSGRYYAMDRDKRWDRVQLAYDALVDAAGPHAASARVAIEAAYAAGVTDEFLLPTVLPGFAGMQAGDGVLMANFRADRARQLLHALLDPAFAGFDRARVVPFAAALGMVEYSQALAAFMPAIFPPEQLADSFGAVVAAAGRTQLRIAETEKYAHVTFFFNGGLEEPFAGEDRILIPSPNVATYDLQPEMAAAQVADAIVAAVEAERYDLIVVNFANTDMVGHTGSIPAAIRAVEAVDACVGRILDAVSAKGGAMVISADHGNAECMHDDATQQAHTAHTLNVVPVIVAGPAFAGSNAPLRDGGRLADLAPTVLALMGLAQPAAMTGGSLLVAGVHA